jgi:hypothetical protein
VPSLMNGLSAAGAGISAFGASAGLESMKADAAQALQASGGVIQGNLLAQKAGLEQQQAVLADQLATTRESGGRVQAAGLAATAASTAAGVAAEQARLADVRMAARESAGRQETAQLAATAPTPEIKSAKQFATLSPAEKQAYREEMMTKAGLPAWMIGGDSPSPPTGSGAISDIPTITPDATNATPTAPVTGTTDTSVNRNDKALENVPGAAASIVKGMVDGRIAPPSSFALSKPYWQGLISKAAEYDPTFDQTTWAGRVATRKDFAAGKSAVAVTALNTALSHAGTLIGDFDALGNFSFTPANAVLNAVEPIFGDSRQGKAQETVDALASEARKVFAASGGGNLTELQEWQKNFPLNGSPDQQHKALSGFVELLDGRLQGLADQYNRGMGRTDDPINLLQPKARAVYEKLTGREPTNATGYQTGQPPEAQTAGGAAGRIITGGVLGGPIGAGLAAGREATQAVRSLLPSGQTQPTPASLVPAWVKPGDQYSPSRGQARGADGKVYEAP